MSACWNTRGLGGANWTQTGHRSRPRLRKATVRQSISGKRAGTTTTQQTTFQHNSSMSTQRRDQIGLL